jgi:hypothetical protein
MPPQPTSPSPLPAQLQYLQLLELPQQQAAALPISGVHISLVERLMLLKWIRWKGVVQDGRDLG